MANQSNSPASYFSQTQQLQRNVGDVSKKPIVESPLVQPPSAQPNGASISSQTPPKPPAKKNSKLFVRLAAAGVLVLVLIGGGVGLYLMNQSQDTRQQASTPTGIGRVFVTPPTSNLIANQAQEVEVKFNMGEEIPIDGIQIVVEITGTVPEDISFEENTAIQGLNFVNGTFSDIPNGKKLVIGFLATSPGPYQTSLFDVTVGSIKFTNPNTGTMSYKFDPILSKVIRNLTGDDILKTPTEVVTYTFTGGSQATATPSATPLSGVKKELTSTLRGTAEIPSNTSTASGTVKMSFDDTADTFSLDATVSGLLASEITGSHIHLGGASQSGQVLVDLGTGWTSNTNNSLRLSIVSEDFPATQSAALLAGNTYFNVHTTEYPNGEIRGQLVTDTGGIGGASPTATPTPKGTATPTPKTSATPTPTGMATASSTPTSSTSATPIPLPVTGSTENTIAFLLVGIVLLSTGAYFVWKG